MTPFQLDESAKAPWTSTTVGRPGSPRVTDHAPFGGTEGRRRSPPPPSLVAAQRTDRNDLRSSSEKTCGSSQAAKWPPFGASLK